MPFVDSLGSEKKLINKFNIEGAFMSNKIWVLFLLCIFLFVPAVCISSEDNISSDMEATKSTVYAQSKEAVEDLLMFWEEKDLFVQTATRSVKPVSQVAENITVISAKEIEDMNAHTVSEVLNRVTGIFVDFSGQDFGSNALLYIQGSAERHVLVMLDGITWNFHEQRHCRDEFHTSKDNQEDRGDQGASILCLGLFAWRRDQYHNQRRW